uniref:Uncharacterized protein n=1 Tax=Psilocybe cubensis TaxID=181762 RepID=A0A8H8CKY1_PSICU
MIVNISDTHVATSTVVDSSDAASTNTLVSAEQKVPGSLTTFVILSLIMSTLALAFSISNNVGDGQFSNIPNSIAAPVLAFVFTLPHHGAILLLRWLQHHDMASILPFTPYSARSIGYLFALLALWIVSTAIGARNGAAEIQTFDLDWSMAAAITTCTLELVFIIVIVVICVKQYRRHAKTNDPTPFSVETSHSQPKIAQV